MMITLENFLDELSSKDLDKVKERVNELVQEKQGFENTIDFFITHLDGETGKTSEADRNYLLENPPTLNELSAAVYVAVHGGADLKESFENALVVVRHWGTLATLPGDTELSYDGAIRILAGEHGAVEFMKTHRVHPDVLVSSVKMWLENANSQYDVIEAGLRVLYEYHLWDTKNEHAEVEGDSEGS